MTDIRLYYRNDDFVQDFVIYKDAVFCVIIRFSNNYDLLKSDIEKNIAVNISKTLFSSMNWAKTASIEEVQQRVIDAINAIEGLEVEYYEIVDKTTLQPTHTFDNAIGCITVYCGQVRLIDNIQY